jgi:RNA polymerase sigma-70 factor (ECF subfamily)
MVGREERFLQLVESNRGRIARIARSYAGDDWQDLQQDILLQVWRGLDRFEERSSAATWLYRVALNTALTWRRKTAPAARTIVPAPEAMPEPAGALGPQDPLDVLDGFLATLSPLDRAILLLYLEDTSYADMAEVTGLTPGNVGVRINRLKKAFVDRYIGDRRWNSTS